MSSNQYSNDTDLISPPNAEISIPRVARFWILLLFEVSSTPCSLFVLFYVLTDRKLRSSMKNHTLIAILILGLSCQLIDVPFYLNFIIHSAVVPSNPSVCLLWWFVDIGLYNGGAILMFWMSLERHIIVFHEGWISTRMRRIFMHYTPLITLVLYIFVYYIYAVFYFPCENTYDYTMPFCNSSPCHLNDPIIGMWDLIANAAAPSILEAFSSLAFLARVIFHKHRAHQRIQWRKHRKMTIQLLSFSSLNMAFLTPIAIMSIAYLCGLSRDVGVQAIQYFIFFCYFIIFLFPFICLASIGDVKKKFQEKILRRRQINPHQTMTVRPLAVKTNTVIANIDIP